MSLVHGKPARAVSSLSNYAMSRNGSIAAFAPNCKRVRYRKNECRDCLDACPENAIVLNPGPEISRACTECGLCVTACPTEVFRDESRGEQSLWNHAAQLRASQAGQHRKPVLSVTCHQVRSPGRGSLSVHCLGKITSYFVAALVFLGFEELQFKKSDCSNCRLREGERLFLHSVQTATTLLSEAKSAPSVIHVEAGRREEVLPDRRRFFSPLANVLRGMQRNAGGTDSENMADSMSGRNLFYHLLEHGTIPALPKVRYSPDLPWGRVAIDARICTGCAICAAVCPTGALAESTERGCRFLHFDSAFCFNCRLCIEACSQKAVRFEEEFTLARRSGDGAQVLARISLPACTLCGDHMRAGGGGLCPTCERRQLTPAGIPARNDSAGSGPDNILV